MPRIQPIHAIHYPFAKHNGDLSAVIAPPYDVLDEASKDALLTKSQYNIVAIDLPHLPPKTVGPDSAYQGAGELFRRWIDEGVLVRSEQPVIFVYQQTFSVGDKTFHRRGLIANVFVQSFGAGPEGYGGIWPHEQTFSAAKEDRLKLTRATEAQLSPIFGIYSDESQKVENLLAETVQSGPAQAQGITNDGVKHELWPIQTDAQLAAFQEALGPLDVFIADGHHRYNTALNYRNELQGTGEAMGTGSHPADWCLFVLVGMQNEGMIILPTHRVLGNMPGFSMDKLKAAAASQLDIVPFTGGDLAALEAALPSHGPHAMGLYDPSGSEHQMYIATTKGDDPLASTHAERSEAWRKLDVAVLQHLIVEQICEPTFGDGQGSIKWKFPHELSVLKELTHSEEFQLGVVMQATPLASVRGVSEAGDLMPQKSTFFYPKLATGLAINPVA